MAQKFLICKIVLTHNYVYSVFYIAGLLGTHDIFTVLNDPLIRPCVSEGKEQYSNQIITTARGICVISIRAMPSINLYPWIALQILKTDDLNMQRENVLLCAQYQWCSCMTTRFDRSLKDGNVTPYKPPLNPSIIQPRWKCYIPELFYLS